jgi:hypothetical protein
MDLDDEDENILTSPKLIFLNLLYPTFNNKTAFDIAMDKKSPKSIEMMLGMLI